MASGDKFLVQNNTEKRISLILISKIAFCVCVCVCASSLLAFRARNLWIFIVLVVYWNWKEMSERNWNNDLSFSKRRIRVFEWMGDSLFWHNEKVMRANTHPFIWIFDSGIEHYPWHFFCPCHKSHFFNTLHWIDPHVRASCHITFVGTSVKLYVYVWVVVMVHEIRKTSTEFLLFCRYDCCNNGDEKNVRITRRAQVRAHRHESR